MYSWGEGRRGNLHTEGSKIRLCRHVCMLLQCNLKGGGRRLEEGDEEGE